MTDLKYVQKINELEDDRDYFKSKASNLEAGYMQLQDENEELKSFIKSLASPDGIIWLLSGFGYRIPKILKEDD